jgi:hypothetical protein
MKTFEEVKKNVIAFIEKNNREPTYVDFDTDPSLPTSRHCQRNFGGLKKLREDMGLSVTDYTKGDIRRKVAEKAFNKSKKDEAVIFNALHEKHDTGVVLEDDKEFIIVSRQYQYQQYIPPDEVWREGYSNISADIAISDRRKAHIIMFDIFTPHNINSLQGCVNTKKRKLEKSPIRLNPGFTHELYFVCTNKEFTQEEINERTVPNETYTVLSYDSFHDKFLK